MVADGNTQPVILAGNPVPDGVWQVRDDQGREWERHADGRFHTSDNRHHESPAELSARSDLMVLSFDRMGLAA